jgi:hypothetical protein
VTRERDAVVTGHGVARVRSPTITLLPEHPMVACAGGDIES